MLPLPIALNKHNINQLKKKKSINIMEISILLYIGLKNNFFKLSLDGVLLLDGYRHPGVISIHADWKDSMEALTDRRCPQLDRPPSDGPQHLGGMDIR